MPGEPEGTRKPQELIKLKGSSYLACGPRVCKGNSRASLGDDAAVRDVKVDALGERRDDLPLGDRNQGLTSQAADHVEEELAARRIELARDVVEEQHGDVGAARLDVRELRELEREHERTQLALGRVLAREAVREDDLEIGRASCRERV